MEKPQTHRISRTAAALMAVAATMPVITTTALAAPSLAEREQVRRLALVADAETALEAGRAAQKENDYETAVDQYRKALALLPQGKVTEERRKVFTKHLASASIGLAEQYRKTGKAGEARDLVNGVLEVDPDNKSASRTLNHINDSDRTNLALSEGHISNVAAVKDALAKAQGYIDLADFDKAELEYHKVLRIDNYNKAAQRGIERINKYRADYYRAAYDSTRAALLAEVDKAWVKAIPSDIDTREVREKTNVGNTKSQRIQDKLSTLILPDINLEDVTVREVIEELRQRAYELDVNSPAADRGINVFLRLSTGGNSGDAELDAEAGSGDLGATVIPEIKLTNVPLGEVLRLVVEEAGLRYKVKNYGIEIVPNSDAGDVSIRRFVVPPNFRSLIDGGSEDGGDGGDDIFGGGGDDGGARIAPLKSVQKLLEANGVPFSADGAKASLIGNGTLVVTNTPQGLDLVENIVNSVSLDLPKQIKITTKFIEVSQENTDELGFDWLVQPFGVTANSAFLSGGTLGAGSERGSADFINSVNGTLINQAGGAAGTSTNQNIVTSGLRSGDFAVNRNSIDAVLNNPNRTAQSSSVSPGILALTGIFSESQVQVVMRGLQQRKGTDVMTAPSVMARSGEKATIEVVREFIYPTEYEPPELPNNVGIGGGFNNNGGGLGGLGQSQSSGIFPVTPATPTAFDTRKTGVTLEIEPTLGSNAYTIDLRFVPEIAEFEGFINYGAPIQSPGTDALGNSDPVTITDNRIEMPVFASRRVQTAITIYDGHTVAVGGLMREDVQSVEDQVPILGDIPLVGRLFKSESENRIKSNLIIFVTAEVIDASGNPFNRDKSSDGPDVLPELGLE